MLPIPYGISRTQQYERQSLGRQRPLWVGSGP